MSEPCIRFEQRDRGQEPVYCAELTVADCRPIVVKLLRERGVFTQSVARASVTVNSSWTVTEPRAFAAQLRDLVRD